MWEHRGDAHAACGGTKREAIGASAAASAAAAGAESSTTMLMHFGFFTAPWVCRGGGAYDGFHIALAVSDLLSPT